MVVRLPPTVLRKFPNLPARVLRRIATARMTVIERACVFVQIPLLNKRGGTLIPTTILAALSRSKSGTKIGWNGNCGPIKGKERGKTSRQIADYFGEPFKRGKNCDTCPISSRTPREDSQTFRSVRCSEYLRRRWRLLPPPGCTLLMTSAASQRTRGQLR